MRASRRLMDWRITAFRLIRPTCLRVTRTSRHMERVRVTRSSGSLAAQTKRLALGEVAIRERAHRILLQADLERGRDHVEALRQLGLDPHPHSPQRFLAGRAGDE